MPPKKIDPKEEEALRLAEEQRLADEKQKILREQQEQQQREEERLKQEQMAKRYEIITLSTGLELVINQWVIQTAYKHPCPKDFLVDFIRKQLCTLEILRNFETIEIVILAEYTLYNLIFVKEELNLDDFKAAILVNILWEILKFNNKSYYIDKTHQRIQKTKQSDLVYLQKILLNHSLENPPLQIKYFDSNQAIKIVKYVQESYFEYYNLYNNIFANSHKKEEVNLMILVEDPLEVLPLSQGLYMGKQCLQYDNDKDSVDEYQQTNAQMLESSLQQDEQITIQSQNINASEMTQRQKTQLVNVQLQNTSQQIYGQDKSIIIQDQSTLLQDVQNPVNEYVETRVQQLNQTFQQSLQDRNQKIVTEIELLNNPPKK